MYLFYLVNLKVGYLTLYCIKILFQHKDYMCILLMNKTLKICKEPKFIYSIKYDLHRLIS